MTWTEADLLRALHVRHGQRSQGAGRRWVIANHVRCDAGFDAARTLDAVALDTWPSSGLALHGFEVKVSRSDWLRELRQPEKVQPWVDRLDYLWLVAPAHVVQGDLPDGWGWLSPTHTDAGLRQQRAARPLHEKAVKSMVPDRSKIDYQWSRPIDRGLVAAFGRALLRERCA